MVKQGIFTGGVQIRNLNGYLIAVNGEVFATTNTGGTTNAFFYQAKTNITSGDPGSGHLIWNNATQTSATQLNISHLTDTPIEDIDIFLSAIVSGNKLVVQDRNDSGSYQSWTVSGTPTQIGSSYWTIPVTLLESQGTGTTGFSNNHDLLFAIITGGTGGGGITTNSITFNNSGSGAASGASFNGGTAVTISYNTIGAQQASASLSALAGLTYASGTPFVKMTGAGTFALDTNTYLTTNQNISISGDASGSGTTAITLTLATVNSNIGTFNNVTVNAKGLVTAASNVSYLTANQTITLSGDISGSGTTAITTTIGANKVTNAMLAQIATARIRGRVSAGTGNVEDLTGTQATTLLDTFTTTLKGLAPASGGGTTNFLRADGTWAAPSGGGTTTNALTINNSGSGAASGTTFNGSSAVTISYNTIGAQAASTNLTSLSGLSYVSASFVKMTAAGTFSLDTNTYLTANQTITLSGNVTGSGTTSIATTIANNVVTNAMLAQVSTATFHGRVTAGTGNIENLTGTQATTLLDVFSSTLKGLAPASGGGTTNFLRADGTWAAPSGGGGGTPAGSNRQIQYNNSGAFGADANLSWSTGNNLLVGTATDNGTDKLQVNGSAIATTLKVNTSGQTSTISNKYQAGTSGFNIFIGNGGGSLSGTSGDQSSYNVSLGHEALAVLTTGFYNFAIGAGALRTTNTGYENVAIGKDALAFNTSGYDNTAIGTPAMVFNTTGYKNTAIGYNSFLYNLTGYSNIAIGVLAGTYISGGSNNQTASQSIYIGEDTRASAAGNTNEIVIGHNAIGQGSNSVTLGNSSITQTLLRGTVTGGSFVKSGGTSSQVLYADGSTKQITSGTAAPTGGSDGDIYLQYV